MTERNGCPPPDADDIPQEKRKRLIQQALDVRTFPPQLAYPEILRNDSDLVVLFSRPVLVWIPEVKRESRKPPCVVSGCSVRETKLTCEHELQSALFTTLREPHASFQKPKIFCKIYDFAACVCDGVRAFSKESLLRRWEVLKKSPSTNGEFKIKFKITRRLLPLVDSTETEANANMTLRRLACRAKNVLAQHHHL
ncbi:hypothetical protein PHPALM_31605 [Phytophthora palmivora]|uniref:Uncharacterized protein n=1 Tax=Phytophthora palmivora TaxID=4796 RepID=A0A2P4X251_9STRA|nr:hypothetical protein PHPALM_31605 [Phytophthora palmivora]